MRFYVSSGEIIYQLVKFPQSQGKGKLVDFIKGYFFYFCKQLKNIFFLWISNTIFNFYVFLDKLFSGQNQICRRKTKGMPSHFSLCPSRMFCISVIISSSFNRNLNSTLRDLSKSIVLPLYMG